GWFYRAHDAEGGTLSVDPRWPKTFNVQHAIPEPYNLELCTEISELPFSGRQLSVREKIQSAPRSDVFQIVTRRLGPSGNFYRTEEGNQGFGPVRLSQPLFEPAADARRH